MRPVSTTLSAFLDANTKFATRHLITVTRKLDPVYGQLLPTLVGAGTFGTTPSIPTGLKVGDILFLVSLAPAPSGWTQGPGGADSICSWQRVPAFGSVAAPSLGSYPGVIVAYRNCASSGNPFEASGTAAATNAQVTPSVTTLSSNARVVLFEHAAITDGGGSFLFISGAITNVVANGYTSPPAGDGAGTSNTAARVKDAIQANPGAISQWTNFVGSSSGGTFSFRVRAAILSLKPYVGWYQPDPAVYRWTDHDRDVVITRPAWPGDPEPAGSQTYAAPSPANGAPLIEIGKRRDVAGTESGELEVTLLCGESATLGGVRLPLAVVQNVLDGASMKVERIFGAGNIDPTMGAMHVFEGPITETDPSSTEVKLKVTDVLDDLQGELPHTHITPPCTNVLFDAQCGLDRTAFTVTGTVSSGATTTSVPTSRTEVDHHFQDGIFTFTSGALNGVSFAIRDFAHTGGAFTPDVPLAQAPAAGDTFAAYPGCPKRKGPPNGVADGRTYCANTDPTQGPAFNNLARFRGFPGQPNWKVVPRDASKLTLDDLKNIIEHRVNLAPALVKDDLGLLPIVYGRRRISAIPIYASAPYAPTPPLRGPMISAIWASAEGPIAGARRAWFSGAFFPNWSNLRQTLLGPLVPFRVPAFAAGTRPSQATWTWLSAHDPTLAIGYPGVAYLAIQDFPLDNSANAPSLELEIDGFLAGTGGDQGDADPAQIVQDLFPNTSYGPSFPWPIVTATGTDGSAASSYARYVSQAGLWLSPALTAARKGLDWLGEILDSTNATCRKGQGAIQIVPLGDTAFGTYVPDTTVQYGFTERDYATGGTADPVEVQRPPRQKLENETYNVIPVSFPERAPLASATDPSYAYESRPIESPEPIDSQRRGQKRGGAVSLDMICRSDVALTIARIKAQESVKRRNTYKFRVGARFCRLEPLDYVQISNARLGLSSVIVRVRSIDEAVGRSGDHVLEIEAEDAPLGMSHAIAHPVQSSEAPANPMPYTPQEVRVQQLAMRNLTPRTIAAADWYGMAWNGTVFCAVGGTAASACSTSPDGVTWTSRTIPGSGAYYYNAVAWNGTVFCAVGGGSLCATSPTGTTWTASAIPTGTWRGITWNGSMFCAVGDSVCATSPDGATWTARTVPAGTWTAVAWNGSVFCAVGFSGSTNIIATSPDGITWTAQTAPAGTGYLAITWHTNGTFCAMGRGGICATSPDGITWTAHDTGMSAYGSLYFVSSIGPVLVAGGQMGTMATSPDGIAWTFLLIAAAPYCVAFNGSVLAVGGYIGNAWTSLAV
jgi:hypothetical protein